MRHLILSYICLFLVTICNAQSWDPTPSPPNFLTDHSFGFSIDGKGYLVTGLQEFIGYTDDFYQYDPYTETWTEMDSFPGPARGYAIGEVWDRKAYLGFGTSNDSLLRDLWVFDPDSSTWTELASCPCDARTHPAMIALNGKIFVGLGGGAGGNMNDFWEYDIATDTWAQMPEFPGVRRHHPYQFASGGYVYAGFGHGAGIFNDWYRFDPSTDTWEQMASLPAEGRVAGTQFSYDGKGYVLSGDGEDHLSMDEGEFWYYEPLDNSWHSLPPHPGKSRWAPASFIIDGVVYLFNGTTYFEGQGYIYQTESYKFDLQGLISSTDETDDRSTIDIYPNPAKEYITVTQNERNVLRPANFHPGATAQQPSIESNERWSIVDSHGRVVLSGNDDQLLQQKRVDISKLTPGSYTLISNQTTGKFVVQK